MRGARLFTSMLFVVTAISCGSGRSEVEVKIRETSLDMRERLMISCPAKAPDTFAWQQKLAKERGLSRPVWEDQAALDDTSKAALDYERTLPADQRAGAYIDDVRNKIVVQVTHDADEVLADLRKEVEQPDEVAVETVRWSEKELGEFASRVAKIQGIGMAGIGYGNANGRVEVDVARNADEARQRISEVIPPCAFKVTRSTPIRPE